MPTDSSRQATYQFHNLGGRTAYNLAAQLGSLAHLCGQDNRPSDWQPLQICIEGLHQEMLQGDGEQIKYQISPDCQHGLKFEEDLVEVIQSSLPRHRGMWHTGASHLHPWQFHLIPPV